MKNLERDKLETLLTIIGSNPSLRLAHFCSDGEILVDMLHEYCYPKEYEYQINCTNKHFYEENVEKFKDFDTTIVRDFSLERKSYMMQGKQYDFIFVTTIIEEEFQEEFLKRLHRIILNSGNVLIFIPKGNHNERYKWIELLEECNYVATSTIDDLFEHYDVIVSKKMHGWGN